MKSVAKKLLEGNKDIKEIQSHDWQVFVVDDDIANAFVVPVSGIIVYTVCTYSTARIVAVTVNSICCNITCMQFK